MWSQWIDTALLPFMYWQEQVSRTREPQRKAELLKALQGAQVTFESHALTQYLSPGVLERTRPLPSHPRVGQRVWTGDLPRVAASPSGFESGPRAS